MAKIQLSVSEFALPVPRTGHIEAESGYGGLPEVGGEIHRFLQSLRAGRHPEFQAEKSISHTFEREGYSFVISGRMDGFYDRETPLIEEIKSTFYAGELLNRLQERPDHPYRLQLRTYGYLHWLQTQKLPKLSLLVVSSRDRKLEEIPVDLDRAEYESWLELRLQELVEEAREFEKIDKRRKDVAKSFVFPFPEPRAGQIELMQTVEESLAEKRPLLVQAPTGLGKTAGVLAPVLKEALARGQKTLYLTPKNSQHAVAEQTLEKIQETGAKVKAMTLTAKSKMCFKNEPVCNPRVCEYARNYYDKVHDQQLVAKLAKKKNLTARVFRQAGRDHEVCPFELQLDVSSRMDVVICDYNYVFSPFNSVGRLSYNGLRKKGSPNLVIDEAHNLAPRAMDYFAPALSAGEILELRERLDHVPSLLRADLREAMDRAVAAIHELRPPGGRSAQVLVDEGRFALLDEEFAKLLVRYLESGAEMQPKDPVLRFCNMWSEFTAALAEKGDGFFVTYRPDPRGDSLKRVCCDASAWLAEGYKSFANVVAFSATLKPFDYYARLSGFDETKTRMAEFTSPFPKENRKLLVIPQVSTKFSARDRESGKIKDAVERIVALRPGNYFVFFPSFDFMRKVADLVEVPGFQILRQEREMKAERIEAYLEQLRSAVPTLIFAVQGGVFSEGVDYPGDMLIGAIIVGPALPTFDLERELMREYFDRRHGSGYDYAYTYPAMAKVVQSAGRVIRSPQDRGLIVLMDQRFVQESFTKSMPADWFRYDVRSLVSRRILGEIAEFWDQPSAPPAEEPAAESAQ